jgi:hypothetical protein
MNTVEEAIEAGMTLAIDFKDRNGKYHQLVKKFDSTEDYENYCDTRMQQSGWKAIGTHILK